MSRTTQQWMKKGVVWVRHSSGAEVTFQAEEKNGIVRYSQANGHEKRVSLYYFVDNYTPKLLEGENAQTEHNDGAETEDTPIRLDQD